MCICVCLNVVYIHPVLALDLTLPIRVRIFKRGLEGKFPERTPRLSLSVSPMLIPFREKKNKGERMRLDKHMKHLHGYTMFIAPNKRLVYKGRYRSKDATKMRIARRRSRAIEEEEEEEEPRRSRRPRAIFPMYVCTFKINNVCL